MAATARSLIAAIILCFSIVAGTGPGPVQHYEELVNATERAVAGARAHVAHMLALQPLPNADKVAQAVASETQHLAHEISQLQATLHEKLPSEAAVAELGPIATKLQEQPTPSPTATGLNEAHQAYLAAVGQVIEVVKRVQVPADDASVKPLLNSALNGLTHDVNNYQAGIHKQVGAHEGQEQFEHSQHHHHHHQHASSEEHSKESSEEHQHHHHH